MKIEMAEIVAGLESENVGRVTADTGRLVVIDARLHDGDPNPNIGVTVTRASSEAARTVELLRQCGYRRVTIRG